MSRPLPSLDFDNPDLDVSSTRNIANSIHEKQVLWKVAMERLFHFQHSKMIYANYLSRHQVDIGINNLFTQVRASITVRDLPIPPRPPRPGTSQPMPEIIPPACPPCAITFEYIPQPGLTEFKPQDHEEAKSWVEKIVVLEHEIQRMLDWARTYRAPHQWRSPEELQRDKERKAREKKAREEVWEEEERRRQRKWDEEVWKMDVDQRGKQYRDSRNEGKGW